MSILVIGSVVCDIVIEIDQIPKLKEDKHILKQSFHIGGCAFNVSQILSLFGCDYRLFAPIGKGMYGDFVRKYFEENHLPIHLSTTKENGCCYCLVDKSGERTFMCEHGGEYLFEKSWFDTIDVTQFDKVYICGLEIEETTGEYIIEFLEDNPQLKIYFAPGPRFNKIDKEKLERIFKLNPLIHLNEQEILEFTLQADLKAACQLLNHHTHYPLIVTMAEKGALLFDGKRTITIPTSPVVPVDTIGAGDGHIGAIIACLQKDYSLEEAIDIANQISLRIVQKKASTLCLDDVDMQTFIKKEIK